MDTTHVLLVSNVDEVTARCREAIELGVPGAQVTVAHTVMEARRALEGDAPIAAIVAHARSCDSPCEAFTCLTGPSSPALVVVGPHDSVDGGPPMIRAGAQDYVRTALIEACLARAVRHGVERQRLRDELRAANTKLEALATRDPLTSLLNRRGLERWLESLDPAAAGLRTAMCALVFDVDLFKSVNDEHGHAVGDEVLRGIAERVEGVARATDRAARVGGDEFVVMLPQMNLVQARAVGQRLCDAVAKTPIHTRAGDVPVTVSAAAVALGAGTASVSDVMAAARVPLGQSKRGGRNRVSIGRVGPRSRRSGRFRRPRRITLIERTLERDELNVSAAPIHDLLTGDVGGMEVRLRASGSAEVSTASVLGAAFNAGSLAELDLRYIAARLEATADLPRSVSAHLNVFPQTLLGDHFGDLLDAIEGSAQGRRVVLGLSASILPMGDPRLAPRLAVLRERDVAIELLDISDDQVAIDAALHLRPTFGRLSGDLVASCAEDSQRRTRVGRIQRILTALGVGVIADGVDHETVARALRRAGVTLGLGRASRPTADPTVEG